MQLFFVIILSFEYAKLPTGHVEKQCIHLLQSLSIFTLDAPHFSITGKNEPCNSPKACDNELNPRFFIFRRERFLHTAFILLWELRKYQRVSFSLASGVMHTLLILFGMKKCSAQITLMWFGGNRSVKALAPSPENAICVQNIITHLFLNNSMCDATNSRMSLGTLDAYTG